MLNTSIVIVEDQKDVLDVYTELLSKLKNTTIKPFISSVEGLDYTIKNKPDIVITDNFMPYADGLHVAKKVREVYNPKIVLIGGVTNGMIRNNQLSYFDKHFVKPFNPSDLISEIDILIEDIVERKSVILNKITSGMLEGINCTGKDKFFIENVIKTLMYDTDRPSEDSVYMLLSKELEKDKSTIRRNINKVVEKTYEPNLFQKILGIKKKPNNREFVNSLLEKINEKAKNERWD